MEKHQIKITHVVFDLNGCSIATLVLIRRLFYDILVVQVSIILIGSLLGAVDRRCGDQEASMII